MHALELDLTAKLRTFGETLASQRKKRGVKQKELATQCEVSQRAQSTYERGEVAPKVDYLFKLLALGYDVQSLIAGEGKLYELTASEQTVIELYRQSPIEIQMAVLEMLAAQVVNPKNGDVINNTNQALLAGIQSNQTKIKKI